MEMKIMLIRSTAKIAINPTEDVKDITAICRKRFPSTNFACRPAGAAMSQKPESSGHPLRKNIPRGKPDWNNQARGGGGPPFPQIKTSAHPPQEAHHPQSGKGGGRGRGGKMKAEAKEASGPEEACIGRRPCLPADQSFGTPRNSGITS